MKKAERIYMDTLAECRKIIERHGYKEHSRLNDLVTEENEPVTTRTFNAIWKFISNSRHSNVLMLQFGAISKEEYELDTNALNMVENTLREAIEIYRKINL